MWNCHRKEIRKLTFRALALRSDEGLTLELNHIRLVFYHNISVKENVFSFRARAENGIAWHIVASRVVWTLTDNGKLANQIARLVAIIQLIDHRSYTHNLSSCEIKAWKKFRPERDSNP